MKFDLIKYNTSQDTSHPIRNKWFRFYKHDMSNEPKLPKEYMSWDSVKRGHAWKKTGKWDPTRLKELRTQVEEWYEFINRDENLIPIHGFWRCYYHLWRRTFTGELIILLPDLYMGNSTIIDGFQKIFWWVFNKLVFSWFGLFLWSLLGFLFTITLINIPLVLLGIVK
jgi:hypothetical protein